MTLISEMYRGAETKVKNRMGILDSFKVRTGVHQGSISSPTSLPHYFG